MGDRNEIWRLRAATKCLWLGIKLSSHSVAIGDNLYTQDNPGRADAVKRKTFYRTVRIFAETDERQKVVW